MMYRELDMKALNFAGC